VETFIGDLGTHRDRAMALLMLLGGLRSGEVRGVLLADVDMGRRRVMIVGKGSRVRVVLVNRPFSPSWPATCARIGRRDA